MALSMSWARLPVDNTPVSALPALHVRQAQRGCARAAGGSEGAPLPGGAKTNCKPCPVSLTPTKRGGGEPRSATGTPPPPRLCGSPKSASGHPWPPPFDYDLRSDETTR